MTNRKLVQVLIGVYAGFVFGVSVLGTSVNLLGSTLNFFSDPTSTQRLAEFDDDGDSVPDLINGPRILEIFRSAANVFAPLFNHPTMVPNMIRLDDAFEMPGTSTHSAAPVMKISEPTGAFDAVAPKWDDEEIRMSNEFEGGTATPGMFLVPSTGVTPSSSLPASLMPPPPTMPSTSSSSATGFGPSSTPPVITAPPSSTPPVTSAPPAVVPPVTSASASSSNDSCSDGMNPDGDMMMDMADQDGGTECDTSGPASSSSSSDADSCSDGMNPDGDMMMDMADMDSGTDCDMNGPASSSSSSSADSCSDGMNSDGDMMMDMADPDGGSECDTSYDGSSSTGF